jgi:hypothetical protein
VCDNPKRKWKCPPVSITWINLEHLASDRVEAFLVDPGPIFVLVVGARNHFLLQEKIQYIRDEIAQHFEMAFVL